MPTAAVRKALASGVLLAFMVVSAGIVAVAARAQEAPADAPGFGEAEVLFVDGNLVRSVRLLTHGLTEEQADEALAEFIVSRGFDPDDAIEVDHDHGQGDDGGVTAAFAPLFAAWYPDDIPVQVRFNSLGGGTLPDLEPAIEYAVDTWNAVQGSTFAFDYQGNSQASTCVGNGPNQDGQNVVRYQLISNPNVLGVTCSIYNIASNPDRYIEFDMELNTSIDWSDELPVPLSDFDVWTTVLHEFGHGMGLGHTTVDCSSASPAVMCASLSPGEAVRTLHQDDVDAVLSVYGDQQAPTATSSPAPTQPSSTPTASATPGGGGSVPTVPGGTPTATGSETPTSTATPPPTPEPTPDDGIDRGPFRIFAPFASKEAAGAEPTNPPAPSPSPSPAPTEMPASADVRITALEDGSEVAGEQAGEWIELRNFGGDAVELLGWEVGNEDGAFHVFGSFTLAPGAAVRVQNCTGVDTADQLYNGRCRPHWHNGAGMAFLRNARGDLVHTFTY